MMKFTTDITSLDRKRVREVHALNKSENVESFIQRQAEHDFRQSLDDPQFYVIALHGSSKQGKSSILRSVFSEDFDALHLELGHAPSPKGIYKALLSAAQAEVKQGRIKKDNFVFGMDKWLVARSEVQNERVSEIVDGDFDEISWVLSTLQKSTKRRIIVLDNFHHVDEENQRRLARDFTVFGAKKFKVVVAGTWKQADYLIDLNGDLREAYTSISVDPWSRSELEKVVWKGSEALGYAMSPEAAKTLSQVARGSIAALQAITCRYYTDQIDRSASYAKSSEHQRANTAAQLVARERVVELAKALIAISDWGSKDNAGRHHVSYIVEAILASVPDDVRRGFVIDDLRTKVEAHARSWCKRRKVEAEFMTPQDFGSKLKVGWMNHQIDTHNTPIVVFDRQTQRVTANDSMLLFVHSVVSTSLLDQFRHQLNARH